MAGNGQARFQEGQLWGERSSACHREILARGKRKVSLQACLDNVRKPPGYRVHPTNALLSSGYQAEFVMEYLMFMVAGIWLQVRFGTVEFSFLLRSVDTLFFVAPFMMRIEYTRVYYTGHDTMTR